MRPRWHLAGLLLMAGCASSPLRVAAIDDMERVRMAAGAQEGALLAKEVYARAEQERTLALAAHAQGDNVGAVLHAQHAVAAYDHGLALARRARAEMEAADAKKALQDSTEQLQGLDVSRAKLESDATELERRVQIARNRMLPAASASASGDHESARLVATTSLATEAHLLCAAARLVATDAEGLSDAEAAVAKLGEQLEKRPHPAPIDDAARARVRCLEVLTRARRGFGEDGDRADALLTELSAAGGWDPSRDERGVVVIMQGAFQGTVLGASSAAKLKDLGRVAAAHPTFSVQVVVHDAQTAGAATDAKRGDAAVKALVDGGAQLARVKAESAGASRPDGGFGRCEGARGERAP